MSGFVLGTGSGVLAAAAVYYTLSTSLNAQTASLRSELHSSSTLLNSSFDPTVPPAPSSFIGPNSQSPHYQPTFSQLLRTKWNESISSLVVGVRRTDWDNVGKEVWGVGESVYDKISLSVNGPSTSTLAAPVEHGSTASPSSPSSSSSSSSSLSTGGIQGGTIYPIAGGVLSPGSSTKDNLVDQVKKGVKNVVEKTQGVNLHIGEEGRVGSDTKVELAKIKGRMV
ncbi:hypothetical protein IAR55_006114 [Kwoniella newhampshirensis]|uniref:MICOS complex subunit MIC12 n=1 Tax=Kwoniella newhampshirensis TaxID=1651941 RepID=A0AAW0YUH4_9TREE